MSLVNRNPVSRWTNIFARALGSTIGIVDRVFLGGQLVGGISGGYTMGARVASELAGDDTEIKKISVLSDTTPQDMYSTGKLEDRTKELGTKEFKLSNEQSWYKYLDMAVSTLGSAVEGGLSKGGGGGKGSTPSKGIDTNIGSVTDRATPDIAGSTTPISGSQEQIAGMDFSKMDYSGFPESFDLKTGDAIEKLNVPKSIDLKTGEPIYEGKDPAGTSSSESPTIKQRKNYGNFTQGAEKSISKFSKYIQDQKGSYGGGILGGVLNTLDKTGILTSTDDEEYYAQSKTRLNNALKLFDKQRFTDINPDLKQTINPSDPSSIAPTTKIFDNNDDWIKSTAKSLENIINFGTY